MIQRVNGVKLMVMVIECPSFAEVSQAVVDGTPVSLVTASYANLVESVGTFELVDIRDVRTTANGFCFKGSIVGVDVNVHPDDGSSIIYVKSGLARVVVDEHGASLQFIIKLRLELLG